MVEVSTEVAGDGDKPTKQKQLWYANTNSSSNEVLSHSGQSLNVLSWTHPGLQIAITHEIGDRKSIREPGYRLISVEPSARARFDNLFPEISGVYQPGGAVRPRTSARAKIGLKSVKLDMTSDQVSAFISRMTGLMIVTGAPGSGKTTVAFQRIRLLFDQQYEGWSDNHGVHYEPSLTRVFLANDNLAEQAKRLLNEELDIPEHIVLSVREFIDSYISHTWPYRHGARPRQRTLSPLERAARAAVLGLSDHHDLMRLWEVYERQIVSKLKFARRSSWMALGRDERGALADLASRLAAVSSQVRIGTDPSASRLSMQAVHSSVGDSYSRARLSVPRGSRRRFDSLFHQWLYDVYDPLSALKSYFGSRSAEAAYRMRRGTGSRVDEATVLRNMLEDWTDRIYSLDDRPWIAWLLRFVLPETNDPHSGFFNVPAAIVPAMTGDLRWTHIVIDEAQDLSVAAASLISSLVDPRGALTVSSDFRQIVSPVRGMTSPEALHVGSTIREYGADRVFPFARNMRQSKQIGSFLQGFYEQAFGERPTFSVNDVLEDIKPHLILSPPHRHALRISQLVAVLRRSADIESVALLQINEDDQSLIRMRSELRRLGMPLAPAWAGSGKGLLTTSVERIKGIEFDACIILGLEEVESASLNCTINRAYVALSRPTRRLFIVAEDFPSILRRVSRRLFDLTQS